MVDSVSNWATRSFLQSQTQGASASASQTTRAATKPAQTILAPMQGASSASQSSAQQMTVPSTTNANSLLAANKNLPRGSIIDMVV